MFEGTVQLYEPALVILLAIVCTVSRSSESPVRRINSAVDPEVFVHFISRLSPMFTVADSDG